MARTIKCTFATRRDAEMALEHFVQELAIERTNISIEAEGQANSAGTKPAGAEQQGAAPGSEKRFGGAFSKSIVVSIDLSNEGLAGEVCGVCSEFGGNVVAGQ